jgi:hypothetical protein
VRVFISWSGDTSLRVAEALRDWLPRVIQAARPWLSFADIEKGARWGTDIARELQETKVSILCLTPDNLSAPWLLFEAGALSKTLERTYVCPYLMGVNVTDLQGPLVQFQAAVANEQDTLRLVQTINGAQGEGALGGNLVADSFRMFWPELRDQLAAAQEAAANRRPAVPVRTERDILEEILSLVRSIARGASESDVETYERIVRNFIVHSPDPWPRGGTASEPLRDYDLKLVTRLLQSANEAAREAAKRKQPPPAAEPPAEPPKEP